MKTLKLFLLVFPVLIFTSCNKSDNEPYPYTVTYKVTSAASAIAVAYYDNGSVVSSEVQSGWSIEAKIDKGYATISAGALDESNTIKVKVQIIRDGKVISENEGLTVTLTDQ